MNIISTLLLPDRGTDYLVVDTLIDGKTLIITAVIGSLEDDTISAVGQQCLNILAAHQQDNFPGRNVHLVEITKAADATVRFLRAIARAEQGDGIIFWCRTSEVYDTIIPLLGLAPANGFVRQ